MYCKHVNVCMNVGANVGLCVYIERERQRERATERERDIYIYIYICIYGTPAKIYVFCLFSALSPNDHLLMTILPFTIVSP